MFKNVRYTTLALFCLTFGVGLISSDVYQPSITLQEKENLKNITSKTSKAVEEALELLEEDKLECVPVDGNLEYRLIKKEPHILVPHTDSKVNKLALINKEIIEIETELDKNEKLTEKQKAELKTKLENLKGQHPFYNSELYGIINERDLLYREVCKEIK